MINRSESELIARELRNQALQRRASLPPQKRAKKPLPVPLGGRAQSQK